MNKLYEKVLTVRVSSQVLKKAKKSGIPIAYTVRRLLNDLAKRKKQRLDGVCK